MVVNDGVHDCGAQSTSEINQEGASYSDRAEESTVIPWENSFGLRKRKGLEAKEKVAIRAATFSVLTEVPKYRRSRVRS